VIDAWSKIEKYFDSLNSREINSVFQLEKWLKDRSELEAVLDEDMAWRYIKMNIDTTDENLSKDFEFFITEIEPKIAPYTNDFNKKLIESEFSKELDENKYFIYLRGIRKQLEIFREENIPLFTELQTDAQKYGAIAAKMTVEVDGETITLQQAAKYLKDLNCKLFPDQNLQLHFEDNFLVLLV